MASADTSEDITVEINQDQESPDLYAVVGNPVNHSLSPEIHRQFAMQTEQNIRYEAFQLPVHHFNEQIKLLIDKKIKGVNVTVPFKQKAWDISDVLSPRAEQAGAVNTLIFRDDGSIAGDNTDGIGLTTDLTQNHNVLVKHRKLLILGAGGAVRGILAPLFIHQPSSITIANRTTENAEQLALDYEEFGDITGCGFDDLENQQFDLIINGTAAGLQNETPDIPDTVLGINTTCYDLMYNIQEPTPFLKWASERGAYREMDGLGMLVEQAAESFYIWRGVRPTTQLVIEMLRKRRLQNPR